MPLRIVFFGTPEASVPSLESLIESAHEVAAVVTAPDRPKGRGMEVQSSPVREEASRAGVSVLQPSTLKSDDVVAELSSFDSDVFVVIAYGLILPKAVLEIPKLAAINLHFSILPKLRGAAPIQWALIEGATLTGVTIIQMDEGIDTGPILAHREEPILPEDDAGSLEARLASKGAELLMEVLHEIEVSAVHPTHQNESVRGGATSAPKLTADDARIDWSMGETAIVNRVRAFNPRPGAWTTWRGKRLKIFKASSSSDASTGEPGTLDVLDERLLVDTGEMRISLEELQPEGAKRMSAAEFVRGYRPASGDHLS